MKLIIAEKPDLGRAIADALDGPSSVANSVISKGDYTVIWAFGHLLRLKMPEDYDAALAKWTLDTLPIGFRDWAQCPNNTRGDSAEKRLAQIGRLLSQCEYVIHAGDPDEEGQLVVDEILRWHGYRGKVYRINTNDTTPAALKKALAQMTDNVPYEPRGWSAYARSVSDLLVGVNLSRYFTLKNPGVSLAIGRVQIPALGLVIARENAVRGHKTQEYYEIHAGLRVDGRNITATYIPKADDPNLEDGKILSRDYADSRADMLRDEIYNDVGVLEKTLMEKPPLPFNLTELQSYCSSRYGYEPMRVLEITQELREKYKAITYNHSDCQYLSEEQYLAAPDTVRQVTENLGRKTPFKGIDVTLHSQCFNDARISAHTAIIPQNVPVDVQSMSEEARNVYKAICQYYIAQFYPPAEKRRTTLAVTVQDGGLLKAVSTTVTKQGYLYLFEKGNASLQSAADADETTELSEIAAGTYMGEVTDTLVDAHQTKPPARYTKASLAKEMSHIAKFVEKPEIRKILLAKDKNKDGENGSIGTVGTRPAIIERLVEHKYIEIIGKKIVPTALGMEIYRILPDQLKLPDMTALWWAIQEDICTGAVTYTKLTDSVMDMIRAVLATDYPPIDLAALPNEQKKPSARMQLSLGLCPRCGHDVVEGRAAFGCRNYKNGCRFKVWKAPPESHRETSLLKEHEITASQIQTWLAGGWRDERRLTDSGVYEQTGRKITNNACAFDKLFNRKTGEYFSGKLLLADDLSSEWGADLKIVTAADKLPLGRCPRCGHDVVEGEETFQCVNRKNGCRFKVWKTPPESRREKSLMRMVTITADNMRTWLADGWRDELEADSTGHIVRTGRKVTKTPCEFRKLYSAKRGEVFRGWLLLADDPASEWGADFTFATAADMVSLGVCPRCGGAVKESGRCFSCENSVEGGTCRFVIWRTSNLPMLAGVEISSDHVRRWLDGEWAEEVELDGNGNERHTGRFLSPKAVSFTKLKKKDGSTFSGRLQLADDPQSRYGPSFKLAPPSRKSDSRPDAPLGKCPRCGGNVIQSSKGYYCENRESGGCMFALWKKTLKSTYMLSKTTITPREMSALLKGEGVKKKTLLRRGGSQCEAALYLSDDQSNMGATLVLQNGERYF